MAGGAAGADGVIEVKVGVGSRAGDAGVLVVVWLVEGALHDVGVWAAV